MKLQSPERINIRVKFLQDTKENVHFQNWFKAHEKCGVVNYILNVGNICFQCKDHGSTINISDKDLEKHFIKIIKERG